MLAHRMSDGMEKPIVFVSRTLTEAERRYAQIEREGLVCVFGVTKLHVYLYGHYFTLITDHKPLFLVNTGEFRHKHPQEYNAGH